jgi:hypothetical protein
MAQSGAPPLLPAPQQVAAQANQVNVMSPKAAQYPTSSALNARQEVDEQLTKLAALVPGMLQFEDAVKDASGYGPDPAMSKPIPTGLCSGITINSGAVNHNGDRWNGHPPQSPSGIGGTLNPGWASNNGVNCGNRQPRSMSNAAVPDKMACTKTVCAKATPCRLITRDELKRWGQEARSKNGSGTWSSQDSSKRASVFEPVRLASSCAIAEAQRMHGGGLKKEGVVTAAEFATLKPAVVTGKPTSPGG